MKTTLYCMFLATFLEEEERFMSTSGSNYTTHLLAHGHMALITAIIERWLMGNQKPSKCAEGGSSRVKESDGDLDYLWNQKVWNLNSNLCLFVFALLTFVCLTDENNQSFPPLVAFNGNLLIISIILINNRCWLYLSFVCSSSCILFNHNNHRKALFVCTSEMHEYVGGEIAFTSA